MNFPDILSAFSDTRLPISLSAFGIDSTLPLKRPDTSLGTLHLLFEPWLHPTSMSGANCKIIEGAGTSSLALSRSLPPSPAPGLSRFCRIGRHRKKYVGQKYSPKNKYYFASFNNDRGLSLDDKTKDYVNRNTGGQVYLLHEVTQLG